MQKKIAEPGIKPGDDFTFFLAHIEIRKDFPLTLSASFCFSPVRNPTKPVP
jgi:hypothetical protein